MATVICLDEHSQQLVADDAANMVQIELAGLKSNGITCALAFDNGALFVT